MRTEFSLPPVVPTPTTGGLVDHIIENAEKTLAYVYRLWGHEVVLDTTLEGKRTHLTYGERGFAAKTVK